METPHKFIIAEFSISKLGSSSVRRSLRIESSAIINVRDVSAKLYFNLIFTMQTYKELISPLADVNTAVSPFLVLDEKQ